jgi:carotenoid cleavage dioxygenase
MEMAVNADITRRGFNHLMGTATAAAGLGAAASSANDLQTAAIAWTSDDPHLSGNFAPIGPEVDVSDLPVVAGRIPPDLSGVYMRNGPNPLFKPIAFVYPMDGDGMIHAVYLDNGRARYRNRFVQTNSLAVERRAGRAVYGSFVHPVPVDPTLIRPGDNPGPFKNGTFINVIRHGGHLLALNEATTCYEMTMELDTIGEWKAGSDRPIRLGAHNRRHPQSGEMYSLAYTTREPSVLIHHIDASGQLVKSFPVALAAPTMIHDFVLTERHIVLICGPAIFDVNAAKEMKPMLQWQPSLGTRIGLVPLDGSAPVWIETDAFFAFHFGNGFERGGDIIIDYVQHESFNLSYAAKRKPPTLHRMTINLASRAVRDAQISDMPTEFPRVNDQLEALATRFVYLPTLTDTLRVPNPLAATFNTMVKADTETGKLVRHDFGNRIAGEAAFIPRGAHGREDDGYLAVFAFDPVNHTSDFVLLDAAHLDAEPVAVIRLPQRVPQGLHGNWIPKA